LGGFDRLASGEEYYQTAFKGEASCYVIEGLAFQDNNQGSTSPAYRLE
jgi:hypothetical protein